MECITNILIMNIFNAFLQIILSHKSIDYNNIIISTYTQDFILCEMIQFKLGTNVIFFSL